MSTKLSDEYRQMVNKDRKKVSTAAKEFLIELGNDKELQKSTYRQFRFKLLKGNYRSQREKELILQILDQLKKIFEA